MCFSYSNLFTKCRPSRSVAALCIFGSPAWQLLHVTLLTPKILKMASTLLENACTPALSNVQLFFVPGHGKMCVFLSVHYYPLNVPPPPVNGINRGCQAIVVICQYVVISVELILKHVRVKMNYKTYRSDVE